MTMDRAISKTLHWKMPQLKRAVKSGDVVGLAAKIDHIEFLLTGGIKRGVLVKSDGTLKTFKSELLAWEAIENIKGDSLEWSAEKIRFSPPPILRRETPEISLEPGRLDWSYWLERRPLVLELNQDVPKYLMLPEVHTVLHHVKDLELHFLIDTLWHTGARISEALSLTRESFTLDTTHNSYVVIQTLKQKVRGRPKKEDKSAKPRLVEIVDPAYIEAVKRYIATQKPAKGVPIFTMDRHNVSYRFKTLNKILDLPVGKLTPHTLRHSFAVNALIQGRSSSVIQRWLGHRSSESTQVYLKVLSGETGHLMYGMQF
ncbi:hypothetical protein A9Q81_15925 [Gammaproteobacteria bacterium 42_54_T18]|nr:hypothetical protein A9Q81_15925 [Gammaproteobacteria bacterium 42_54_T18]